MWKIKYIRYGNSNLWHKKYSLPCTKVLGLVACRVTSKVLGIGAEDLSLGDIKIIKSGKRSVIINDVSDKHSIVYTSACIESAIIQNIVQTNNLMKKNSSHTWNEEDDAFDNQFEKWGVVKIIFRSFRNCQKRAEILH